MTFKTTTAIALALAAATGVHAQTADPIEGGEIAFAGWSYAELYSGQGWSVDALFGTDVIDANGEEIGDVEDLVLNADGQVIAVIAEVGGLWDIGDTHVSVPWEDVAFNEGESVVLPVTEETVESYDPFEFSGLQGTALGSEIVAGVDDEPLGAAVWRASDLMGDYVRIRDESTDAYLNYGMVRDLIVEDGQVIATVVNATGPYGPGTYAYPYWPSRADGPANWSPSAPAYDMPLIEGDVQSLEPFDYERIGEG